MTRFVNNGILGGLVLWQEEYEREHYGGPYTKLVKTRIRLFWGIITMELKHK